MRELFIGMFLFICIIILAACQDEPNPQNPVITTEPIYTTKALSEEDMQIIQRNAEILFEKLDYEGYYKGAERTAEFLARYDVLEIQKLIIEREYRKTYYYICIEDISEKTYCVGINSVSGSILVIRKNNWEGEIVYEKKMVPID